VSASPLARAVARFRRNRGASVGALLVIAVLVAAAAAPLLSRVDPLQPHIADGLSAVGGPVGPGGDYPLGTDELGRSVWSRLVHGAGVSLEVGFLATALALTLGLAIGLAAGYAGGVVDQLLMRLVDMFLAFPFLLLAILLAVLLRQTSIGGGIAPVFITLGVVSWTTMARVIRGKVLSLRESEFVQAARAIGAGPGRIVLRHLLPNVVGPVVVLATLGFAQNLLAEAVLSYLGLGPPPPTPTWGRMLYEGQSYYRTAPWLIMAPGIAILMTVAGFNLLGEGLRDALDPRDRR
jgi:ABC-type dipeptide/oligopeptide/nickel transport system permease subunit